MEIERHPELNQWNVSVLGGVVVVLEFEAEPRIFCDPDSLRRVLVGLSDEWREVLDPVFELYGERHGTDESDET